MTTRKYLAGVGLAAATALLIASGPAGATTGTSAAAAALNSEIVQAITAMGATVTSIAAVTGGFQVHFSTGASVFVPQTGFLDRGDSKTLFVEGATGFSAQGNERRFAIWGQYAYTRFDEDQRAVDSDGSTHAFTVGGDYLINRWMRGGIAFTFDHTNIDTTFNRGKSRTNGYSFSPYALFQLIENRLFFDTTIGYGVTDQKSNRNSGTITSTSDGDRLFASANLTSIFAVKNWSIRPGAGILWSRSATDSYRESNGILAAANVNHFGRMHLGSEFGYNFARWQPFVSAKYLYDYKFDYPKFTGVTQPTEHRSAAQFGLGASFSLTNRLTGSVKGTTEAFRKDNSNHSFTGSMRYAF
jgi:outer membrane autotransporter protein